MSELFINALDLFLISLIYLVSSQLSQAFGENKVECDSQEVYKDYL